MSTAGLPASTPATGWSSTSRCPTTRRARSSSRCTTSSTMPPTATKTTSRCSSVIPRAILTATPIPAVLLSASMTTCLWWTSAPAPQAPCRTWRWNWTNRCSRTAPNPAYDRYNGSEAESGAGTANGGADDVAPVATNYNQTPVIETAPLLPRRSAAAPPTPARSASCSPAGQAASLARTIRPRPPSRRSALC